MATKYVSPNGSNSNGDGTKSNPYENWEPTYPYGSQIDPVSDGDTVIFLEGDGSAIVLDEANRSGYYDVNNLTFKAEPGEAPTLTTTGSGTDSSGDGALHFNGSSTGMTITGLEIDGALGPGITSGDSVGLGTGGSITDCNIHHCGGSGIHLRSTGSGGVVRYVESWMNFGPDANDTGSTIGGDADGIGAGGANNPYYNDLLVEHCALHHNSDDGVDAIASDGLTFRNNLVWGNGMQADGSRFPEGDTIPSSTGIKLGYDDDVAKNIECYDNVSWGNGGPGIYNRSDGGGYEIYNNTCIYNGQKSGRAGYVNPGHSFHLNSGNSDTSFYDNIGNQSGSELSAVTGQTNSWQVAASDVQDSWFVDTAVGTAFNRVTGEFLRLASGSPMIDAGQSVS